MEWSSLFTNVGHIKETQQNDKSTFESSKDGMTIWLRELCIITTKSEN